MARPFNPRDPVLWTSLFTILAVVYLVARVVTWAAMSAALYRWRRSGQKPWPERARLAAAGRQIGALATFLVVIPLAIATGQDGRRIELFPPIVTVFLLVVAGWTGVLHARIRLERKLNPAMALVPRAERAIWLSNWSYRGVLLLVGFVVFGVMPRQAGPIAWAALACGALAAAVHVIWGWVLLWRALGIIRPASERIRAIVEQTADQMNVRRKAVDELPIPVANAFALFVQGCIGVTTPTSEVLTDDELASICAHELAHLSESRWVYTVRVMYVVLIGIWVVAPAAIRLLLDDTGPTTALVLSCALAASAVGIMIYRQVFRRMEIRADKLARQFESSPGTSARALEKVYAANFFPVVAAKRRYSHPELYDRMVAAGAPPDYPRPAPPPSYLLYLGLLILFAGVIAGAIGLDQLALAIARL
jgi:Zn-dependent protease with chaperone function